jgi:hypothetical protein
MLIKQNVIYTNAKGTKYWIEKENDLTYYLCLDTKTLHSPCYRSKHGDTEVFYSDLGGFEPSGGPDIYLGVSYGFGIVRKLAKVDDNCLEITVFEE